MPENPDRGRGARGARSRLPVRDADPVQRLHSRQRAAGAFACEPRAPGWPEGDEGDWRCAEVSALSFNENLVEFRWLPGKAKEGRTRYDLAPRFDYVQVQNRVKIDDRSRWNWRAFRRQPTSNLIDAEGWLPPKTSATDYVAIHQPVKFFMQALKTALGEEGVAVSGPAVDLADLAAPDVATSGSLPLFARQSPPLTQLIGPVLRYDQNLRAELLFLALAKQRSRGATFGGGSLAVGEFLWERGAAAPGSVVVDGSGLSRSNQTSAKELVALMKMMAREPAGDAFFAAFPQGGQPGLLAGRFQESDAARAAAPRVFAMAGFLPGAHTMAGWTTSAGGRKVYFAFLLNESRLGKSAARENLDRLVL
ncbi:MAG: D-alanyl-D-alanine carboxypeptidase/D-alanyl-D-alanine-endopeptidase [Candidatus Sumerlaeota bacterium]|nr:D-alanyl-D-alanine carboxypeptidase/D-alanyl-D-alanine-endopeptidase [Candidatus Sumerlaeota bacterium]